MKTGSTTSPPVTFRAAAAEGDRDGLRALADYLAQTDRHDEAIPIPVLEQLVAQGSQPAEYQPGVAHQACDRLEAAIAAYRVAMRDPRGRHWSARAYGALLVRGVADDDPAEGEDLLRRSRRAGRYYLGWLLESRGEWAEAERLYAQAADEGVDEQAAAAGVARLVERRGDAGAARDWRARAGVAGAQPEPSTRHEEWGGELLEAWQLEKRGDFAGAEDLYRGLALSDLGQSDAQAGLARMLERRGETAEARRWRESAEALGASLDGPESPEPPEPPG